MILATLTVEEHVFEMHELYKKINKWTQMSFDARHIKRMKSVLLISVCLLFSLYVINVIGAVELLREVLGGRRYLNVLWLFLFSYAFLNWKGIDWTLFRLYSWVIIPVIVTCLFLYFYHDCSFDLSYAKYVILFLLAGSICSNIKSFNLRKFFVIGALSCIVIFFVALYQIYVLDYLVPNGDLNQNIFASMAMIIGSATFFAYLYPCFHSVERFVYALCGSLAIWVALRTTCRTAYVTELILCFLFLYLARIKLHWALKESIFFVFLIALSMYFVVIFSQAEAEQKFSVISKQIFDFFDLNAKETTSSSIGLRLAMWKAAILDVIPNHFLFGLGDIRRCDWLRLITGSSIDPTFLRTLRHFHNEGINIFVTGGLLLFLVSNWLLYQLFQAARGEPVLLCLLVGSVSWGITEVAFFHKNYFFVFLSLWLLYECALYNEHRRSNL